MATRHGALAPTTVATWRLCLSSVSRNKRFPLSLAQADAQLKLRTEKARKSVPVRRGSYDTPPQWELSRPGEHEGSPFFAAGISVIRWTFVKCYPGNICTLPKPRLRFRGRSAASLTICWFCREFEAKYTGSEEIRFDARRVIDRPSDPRLWTAPRAD
jgi:hypothetical protein